MPWLYSSPYSFVIFCIEPLSFKIVQYPKPQPRDIIQVPAEDFLANNFSQATPQAALIFPSTNSVSGGLCPVQSLNTVEDLIMAVRTHGGGLLLRLAKIRHSHTRGYIGSHSPEKSIHNKKTHLLFPWKCTLLCYFLFCFISSPVAQVFASLCGLYSCVTSRVYRLSDCLRSDRTDSWTASQMCQHVGCRISKTDVEDQWLGQLGAVCAPVIQSHQV